MMGLTGWYYMLGTVSKQYICVFLNTEIWVLLYMY